MADQWTWYRAALAGEKPEPSDGVVESGFYWTKASKAGGRLPVAIWRALDGTFNCRVGAKGSERTIEFDKAAERWPWVCANPVDRESYKTAFTTGAWPDGTPTSAPEAAAAARTNLPSDPFERLQAEIADKMASAEAWMKAHPEAKSQTDADYATNLKREIDGLLKQADAMHTTEKAPHQAAAKAVDDRFRFRDAMKATGVSLRAIFERFMVTKEQMARKAAQEKFEAERKAAEAARREAEAAFKKKMDDDPIGALTDQALELPEVPTAPEKVKVQSGGGIGRAAGLKSVWVGTIDDLDAVYAHFRETDQVRDVLQKLVDATVRTNKGATKIGGVSVREERRAA